jgi:hypothetical protein
MVEASNLNKKGTEKENKKEKKRMFKAIYIDPNGEVVMEGRHKGLKPQQAAYKALTGIYEIFAEEGKNIDGEVKFGICETTRGSKRKNFWYTGKKKEAKEETKLYTLPNDDEGNEEKKKNKNVLFYALPETDEIRNIVDKFNAKQKKTNKKFFTAQNIEEMGGFEKIFGKEEKYVKPLKKYFTAKNINDGMGGFEEIFGKTEENVIPSIIYKAKNNIKKTNTNECLELFNPKIKDEKILNTIVNSNLNKKGYKKTTMKKTNFET